MTLYIFKKGLAYVKRKLYALSTLLNKTKKEVIKMRVFTPKKQQPINRRNRRQTLPLHKRQDILGVVLVLLVASAAYSSIAVWFNISTVGIVPKLMLLPQIVAAVGVIIWKFTK